jgi:hypothetical protein
VKPQGWRSLRPAATLLAAGVLGCTAGAAQSRTGADTDTALPAVSIRAPHHGEVLYQLFQSRHFDALAALTVSQHFARLAPHDDEAEVLRGGLLLQHGLHDEARQVFERLIERQAPPRVRDRAWFFLARIQHQRGLVAAAEATLARIGLPLASGLEEEHQLLRAQLAMAVGDLPRAVAVLEALADPANPRPPGVAALMLARFNLAVALLQQGDEPATARGRALLEQIGQTPAADEEQRSLRDRANLALGFDALRAARPREARSALQRVRLEGAQSNAALLGYGWAAASLNDPRLALVPWTELAGREMADAAVLEAQIAVPYAMAEAGAYSQALAGYRQAVVAFERESRALDESIAAIHAGRFVDSLVERNAGTPDDEGQGGLSAFARLDQLPEMPHGAHLRPLLADHPFQETWKQLRDLRFMATHLAHWQRNLASFADLIDARRDAFAARLPQVRAAAGANDLAALEARRAALEAELATAGANDDAAAFADERERALAARVAAGRAALAAARAAPDVAGLSPPQIAELAERLRRAEGALAWQMAERLPERRWQAQKALRDGAAALAAARVRDAALRNAEAAEPARHARFAERLDEAGVRIAALVPQVAALEVEARAQLAAIAVAALVGQQERLAVYAAQARLAIAQILDRAQLAQRGDAPAGSTR